MYITIVANESKIIIVIVLTPHKQTTSDFQQLLKSNWRQNQKSKYWTSMADKWMHHDANMYQEDKASSKIDQEKEYIGQVNTQYR